VSENESFILGRLWTKVHKILEQCRRSFVVVSNTFPVVCMMFRYDDTAY